MSTLTLDQETISRKSTRQLQENTCNSCHLAFSSSNRSILCNKCFQKSCKLHISNDKNQAICELCFRIELKKLYTQEKQEKINTLKSDLRSLQHREKANHKEISVKSEAILKLEKNLKEQEEKFIDKTSEIEKNIQQEIVGYEENCKNITKFSEDIEKSKKGCKEQQEKFVNMTTDLVKIQKDFGSVDSEYQNLIKKIEKVQKACEKMITFQKIRTITCVRCYRNVAIRFKKQIIDILMRKEKKDLIQNILALTNSNHESITSTPCKCLII